MQYYHHFFSPKQFQRSNGDNYQTFPYALVHINFRGELSFFPFSVIHIKICVRANERKTIRKGKRFIAQPNDINLIIVETLSGESSEGKYCDFVKTNKSETFREENKFNFDPESFSVSFHEQHGKNQHQRYAESSNHKNCSFLSPLKS